MRVLLSPWFPCLFALTLAGKHGYDDEIDLSVTVPKYCMNESFLSFCKVQCWRVLIVGHTFVLFKILKLDAMADSKQV